MRKIKKTIAGAILAMSLSFNQAQAMMPVIDTTSIVQQVLQVVYDSMSYATNLKDLLQSATNWKAQLENVKDQLNSIKASFSGLADIYTDNEKFRLAYSESIKNSAAIISDPKEYLNNALKDALPAYRFYDNCANLKDEALKICTAQTVNHIEHNERLKAQRKLQENTNREIAELVDFNNKDLSRTKTLQDRQAEMAAAQLQLTQAQLQNQQDLREFLIEQKRIEDQKSQARIKNVRNFTSLKDTFKDISGYW